MPITGTRASRPHEHGTRASRPHKHGTQASRPHKHGTRASRPHKHGTQASRPHKHGTQASRPHEHGTQASRPHEHNGEPYTPHKGWYSRGYLPHFDSPGLLQGITFHLADSLPAHVVTALLEDPELTQNPAKRARVEAYLNTGYGACCLRDPRIGGMVENALLYFDGKRYRQIAWVVMPNHVHTLIETFEGYPLFDVIQSWKSYTAKQANRILGRTRPFWHRGYFDRYIRNERHFWTAVNYIHNNPVEAGLVKNPTDWPFSSARFWENNGSPSPGAPSS